MQGSDVAVFCNFMYRLVGYSWKNRNLIQLHFFVAINCRTPQSIHGFHALYKNTDLLSLLSYKSCTVHPSFRFVEPATDFASVFSLLVFFTKNFDTSKGVLKADNFLLPSTIFADAGEMKAVSHCYLSCYWPTINIHCFSCYCFSNGNVREPRVKGTAVYSVGNSGFSVLQGWQNFQHLDFSGGRRLVHTDPRSVPGQSLPGYGAWSWALIRMYMNTIHFLYVIEERTVLRRGW